MRRSTRWGKGMIPRRSGRGSGVLRPVVGSLGLFLSGLGLSGCQPPGQLVQVAAPGQAPPRTAPAEKEEPQALGEQAVQAPVDPSRKLPVSGTVSPSTEVGQAKTTPSGVIYETLTPGAGIEARPGQTVIVHYVGTLDDGKVFDSTRDDPGEKPAEFEIGTGQVIPGWDEAVPGMKIGEKRKLTVPPDMGYGSQGKPPTIPPDARLTFEVELVGIK
jgi:FKBP-type peptidyl-prolyl cis-trans isomerase